MKVRVTRIKRFTDFLRRTDKKIMVCYGGAGSGKSRAIATHICELFVKHEDLCILVNRKTMPSLKDSAMKLILEILRSWNVPFIHHQTTTTLTYGASSIIFRSLDDPEKLKSSEYNLIWIEEATDLSKDDFQMLELRLRRPHDRLKHQMFLSFNPIDAFHWCVTDLVQGKRKDVAVMHSNWEDNPFLPETYIQHLLELQRADENIYRIYTLGEPGILRHIIYTKWEVLEAAMWPDDIKSVRPHAYGLDFGFNNPTALVAIWNRDGEIYVREILYQGMTNQDLIERLRDLDIGNVQIAADPSRPDQIDELCRAGFNVFKASNAVKEGIDHVKALHLTIDPESVNLLKEIRSYKYKETRDGRILDEPVEYMNHAMDAMRYGIYTFREQDANGPVPGVEQAVGRSMPGGMAIPDIYHGGFDFQGM